MLLRRAHVQTLRGFDDSLFMYGEDLDLCCRVRRAGLRLHYLSSEVIFHHEGAASKKKGRSFAPLFQRSANYYFLRKNFGRWQAIAYRSAVSLGSAARLLSATLVWPVWRLRADRQSIGKISNFFSKHIDLFLWSIGLRSMPSR